MTKCYLAHLAGVHHQYWKVPAVERCFSALGDHVSCLSFSNFDPTLTWSCRWCCSQRQKTTTVNKFSGIAFYLVCWGISVGGKRQMPSRQAIECERVKTGQISIFSYSIVVCIIFFALLLLDCFVFKALLHPSSPDVDLSAVALAAGIAFSRQLSWHILLQFLLILGGFCLAGTEQLPLPPLINIAGSCQLRPDIVRILLSF